MTNNTKQKILDAALKEFAKKGYDATTTRSISKTAGFTETTIFRKFGNKKNLYQEIIGYGGKKLEYAYHSLQNLNQKYKDPTDFLEAFVRTLAKIRLDHIEIFILLLNEDNIKYDYIIAEVNYFISELIKNNIPNIKVDPNVLGLTIGIYVYSIDLDKYHDRINDITYEERLQKYINNLMLCFKTSKQ
ncbi:MAG: TetR/AcrR family transcriptional regulator [Methanobacterium sp.]|jgi:AcrR family transcriptional regulator